MIPREMAWLVIAALLATACEGVRRFEDDTTYPAAIDDLACQGTAGDTVRCTWTAVGDDEMDGQAVRYWIYRHSARIETGMLEQAVLVDDSLKPAASGTAESYDVTGLEPDTEYWFAVQVADDAGNTSLSVSVTGKTLDSAPPEPVVSLGVTVVPAGSALQLDWTLPADTADLAGVQIVRKRGAAPNGPDDGDVACDSDPSSAGPDCDESTGHEDTGLEDGLEYHYAAFAHDEIPNYAPPVRASGVPADTVPPSPLRGFSAVGLGSSVQLSWQMPIDTTDIAGVRVLRREDDFPEGPEDTDADVIYDDITDPLAHTDTGVELGSTYFYAAYMHDDTPNFSSGLTAQCQVGIQAVTQFQVTDPGQGNRLELSWVNSVTESATHVRIIRFVGSCVENNPDPTVYDYRGELDVTTAGEPQSWTDDNAVQDNVAYCYAVYAKSPDDYSPSSVASGTSTDATPPQVGDFDVVPSTEPDDRAMDLSWTCSQDVLRVLILRRLDAYPDDPSDPEALVILDGLSTGCRDENGIEDGTEYWYRIWVYDEVPFQSAPAETTATRPYVDDDQDGFAEDQHDCDDGDAGFHPGAADPCDGLDQDCDGVFDEDEDADGDTFTTCGTSTTDGSTVVADCDDDNEYIHAGVTERCDGVDQNCDGATDEGLDDDQDGWGKTGTEGCRGRGADCDDENPLIHPRALVRDCSATDWNCDGLLWEDVGCVNSSPDWPDPACTTGPTCEEDVGCDWQEVQDHSPCEVVTSPDYSYDICAEGSCVSPGTYYDSSCNSPGPHFRIPPSIGHTDFARTTAAEPVVTDNVTGLMWQGCAAGWSGGDCLSGSTQQYTWQDALDYCDGLVWGGYDDWHLPDFHELQSILDYGNSPAIDQNAFPNTPAYLFWSSSISTLDHFRAWKVDFDDGGNEYTNKTDDEYARCVRP